MFIGLEYYTNKKSTIRTFKTFDDFSLYKQQNCVLCCNDFKGDVFILPCKHIFDLQCFMTYVKFNYLEKNYSCSDNSSDKGSDSGDKGSDSGDSDSRFAILCPICKVSKVESNTLDLFKKYKLILDFRLCLVKKYNILKQLAYDRDNTSKKYTD
jgi:hypothetical protein